MLLWVAWSVVLLALLAPRPVGLTAARTGAPLALIATVLAVATGRASALASISALVVTTLCVVLVATPSFARTCAQGAAYGDEERFPLKVPPALFLGVLPLAVLAVGAGIAAGPLLLADGVLVLGIVALVVGWPLALLLLRSLHLLSRRWAVLVPAGFVIADPMTLTDPVLFLREHIVGLGPADPRVRPPAEATDLRLGAAHGSLALLLDDDADDLPPRPRPARRRAHPPAPHRSGRGGRACSTTARRGASPVHASLTHGVSLRAIRRRCHRRGGRRRGRARSPGRARRAAAARRTRRGRPASAR